MRRGANPFTLCYQLSVQYRWESGEKNSYIIAEDNTEPLEGSGTRIVLHLKEDAEEYLDDFKVSFFSDYGVL